MHDYPRLSGHYHLITYDPGFEEEGGEALIPFEPAHSDYHLVYK